MRTSSSVLAATVLLQLLGSAGISSPRSVNPAQSQRKPPPDKPIKRVTPGGGLTGGGTGPTITLGLATGGVTGTHVQDGTLELRHLSAGAQAALRGATGSQGAKGDTGEAGPTGPQGLSGATGAKGDKGDTGPQGVPGVPGATGLKGDAGAKGDKGETGAQGPLGVAGVTGATGPQGATGATGARGPQGTVGPMGAPGAMGLLGAPGAKGDTGEAGPQGPMGTKGDKGAEGDQGEIGVQGLMGLQGANGEQGQAGEGAAVEGPDIGGAFSEFGKKGTSAPGGGLFFGYYVDNQLPFELPETVSNRRDQIAFTCPIDTNSDGSFLLNNPDAVGLFLYGSTDAARIAITGQTMPGGGVLETFIPSSYAHIGSDPSAPTLLLDDLGHVYFAAYVKQDGLSRICVYGWSAGQLFAIVGRNETTSEGYPIIGANIPRLLGRKKLLVRILIDARPSALGLYSTHLIYSTP